MGSLKKQFGMGVVVWAILFALCSLPTLFVTPFIGVFTSYSEPVAGWMGEIICPAESEGKLRTYATTTRDKYGNLKPATGYELNCVNASGEVVRVDPVLYSYLWIGLVIVLGLVIAGGGALIGTLVYGGLRGRAARLKDPYRQNIEPR
ncbi:MAG: hypothetical protein DDG59_00360 [Anaerolineae bacterium]|nr:MAG: hypothetical protein DDG59_00360 [Anaerolineae bacterium]